MCVLTNISFVVWGFYAETLLLPIINFLIKYIKCSKRTLELNYQALVTYKMTKATYVTVMCPS